MRKKKVLVVDDNKSIGILLMGALSSYDVFCCLSGKEALEAFSKNQPDLVITDLRMPEMDGEELTRKIKEKSPGAHVIMLTSVTPLPESKADEILEKSPHMEKLHITVNKLLHPPLTISPLLSS